MVEKRHAQDKLKQADKVAETLKALTHPVRIRILQELRTGPVCVTELSERVGVSQTNLSQHLGLLRNYGWVRKRKQALYVYYFLSDRDITAILKEIRRLIHGFE